MSEIPFFKTNIRKTIFVCRVFFSPVPLGTHLHCFGNIAIWVFLPGDSDVAWIFRILFVNTSTNENTSSGKCRMCRNSSATNAQSSFVCNLALHARVNLLALMRATALAIVCSNAASNAWAVFAHHRSPSCHLEGALPQKIRLRTHGFAGFKRVLFWRWRASITFAPRSSSLCRYCTEKVGAMIGAVVATTVRATRLLQKQKQSSCKAEGNPLSKMEALEAGWQPFDMCNVWRGYSRL